MPWTNVFVSVIGLIDDRDTIALCGRRYPLGAYSKVNEIRLYRVSYLGRCLCLPLFCYRGLTWTETRRTCTARSHGCVGLTLGEALADYVNSFRSKGSGVRVVGRDADGPVPDISDEFMYTHEYAADGAMILPGA